MMRFCYKSCPCTKFQWFLWFLRRSWALWWTVCVLKLLIKSWRSSGRLLSLQDTWRIHRSLSRAAKVWRRQQKVSWKHRSVWQRELCLVWRRWCVQCFVCFRWRWRWAPPHRTDLHPGVRGQWPKPSNNSQSRDEALNRLNSDKLFLFCRALLSTPSVCWSHCRVMLMLMLTVSCLTINL